MPNARHAARPHVGRTRSLPGIAAVALALALLAPAIEPVAVQAAAPGPHLAIRNDSNGGGLTGAITPSLPALGWRGIVGGASTLPGPTGGAEGSSAAGTRTTTGLVTPNANPTLAPGGPGMVLANTFAGLTDVSNNASSPGCADLTERPCGDVPDPWIAAGPTAVVQATNWRVRATGRTGTPIANASTASWFGIHAINFDGMTGRVPANQGGRILYDAAHKRWLAADLSYDCTGSVITVMVSKDPTGSPLPLSSLGWTRYTVAFQGEIAAYPTLGDSSGLVAVGVNRYPVTCAAEASGITPIRPVVGQFTGSSLLVFDWAALLAGGVSAPWIDLGPTLDPGTKPNPADPAWVSNPSVFTFVPARQTGLTTAATDLQVAVATKLTAADSRPTGIAYVGISGAVGDPDHGVPSTIPALALQVVGGATVEQPATEPSDPGGTLDQAVDFRLTDAVWRSGRLAVATTGSSTTAGTRPRARIIEMTTSTATVPVATLAQVLTVQPSTGYTDTYMPGVGYAADGTLWAVFSQSGPNANISSWARRQLTADRLPGAADPATAVFSGGLARVAAGRDTYAGVNVRWGDSVGVAFDPVAGNEGSVWQADAFADTLEGWATLVARLGSDVAPPAAPASIAVGLVTRQAVTRTSVTIHLSWGTSSDAASGLGHYELQQRSGPPSGAWTNVHLSAPFQHSLNVAVRIGVHTQFRVRVTDNAGNASAWRTLAVFTPTLIALTSAGGTAFAGAWQSLACSACLSGHVRAARAAGARATLTASGIAFGWLTVVGPSRGSARVTSDGTLVTTVSTLGTANLYGWLVATKAYRAGGRHTFSVAVSGTSGHSRVDLDMFIVLKS